MGIGILLLCLGVPGQAEIYRWVDDQGTVHFSSTPGPETSQRERRVYDSEGRLREVLPAPPTPEERERAARDRAEAERALAAAQAAREDRDARLRQLRRAYESLEDIEALRERRASAIESNLRLSEAQEKTLLRERERIRHQKDRTTGEEVLEARYAAELRELDERIERERSYQKSQRERLQAIHARLDLDQEDFRELVLDDPDGP